MTYRNIIILSQSEVIHTEKEPLVLYATSTSGTNIKIQVCHAKLTMDDPYSTRKYLTQKGWYKTSYIYQINLMYPFQGSMP